MKTDPKGVARHLIQEIMSRTGMAASRLGEKSGVSASTVTRILAGNIKNAPDLRTIVALADQADAQITLTPANHTDGENYTDVALLRLAVQVAIRALADEPNAIDRLPDAVVGAYVWLEDKQRNQIGVTSADEALAMMGTLRRTIDLAGSQG